VEGVSVPHAVRPYADQVVAATDADCLEHLDVEYAGLCRKVVGKLGRKRPCPLTRGDLGIWAAGVVYVVGQLNFVFDPAQTPHASADQLSGWLGVKKTTMANKARLIRDTLRLRTLIASSCVVTWLRPARWSGCWRSTGWWSISGARPCSFRCGLSSSG